MLKHLLLGLAALTAINVTYAAPTYSFVATYDPVNSQAQAEVRELGAGQQDVERDACRVPLQPG